MFWRSLPGNGEVIQSYNPDNNANQLTPLATGEPEESITFECVGGGSVSVGASSGNTTVSAAISVLAPNVTVTATPHPIVAVAGKTYQLAPGTFATKLAQDNTLDQLQMNPLAWVGTTPAGWNYCFAQTASLDAAFSLTADNPAGKIAGYAGIYTTTGPSKGLDGSFPYLGRYFFSPNPTFIGDTPGPKTIVMAGLRYTTFGPRRITCASRSTR